MNQIFLFLFMLAAMIGAQKISHAQALTVTPIVNGYSAGAGTFASSPGGFSTVASGTAYRAAAIIPVGGTSVTVPSVMRMAANAGQFAKNAMRLNPWALAGTLALGYLLDHQFSFDPTTNKWVKGAPSPNGQYCQGQPYPNTGTTLYGPCYFVGTAEAWDYPAQDALTAQCSPGLITGILASGSTWNFYCLPLLALPTEPTQADWDALPDPIPTIYPELPYAPYMPQGVPVSPPEVVPTVVPTGAPITQPDGSVVQPIATITPLPGGEALVSPGFNPITDAAGNPVPQTANSPAADPAAGKAQCELYPSSLGCANLDTPAQEDMGNAERIFSSINPFSIGTSATCPAPLSASFLGQPLEISFDPLCQFANTLRPLIIALAWLSAGMIFVGGVRQNG